MEKAQKMLIKYMRVSWSNYNGVKKQLLMKNSGCCIFLGKINNKKLNGSRLKKSSFEYEVKAHFMDDKIQGEGLLTTKKGDQYKGEFYENKKYGHGEFQTTKGDRYEGEYQKIKNKEEALITFLMAIFIIANFKMIRFMVKEK
ncbi:unnamed protein product [Paramecium octaurelia]|uniref:MORN repeat protein n=1 Tax=Paramecium octaurelia TaxID=43137 RepID=A0A8S1V3N2_PAROT|nr:unnamed protein product [Paramecium octaurelia]